MPLHYIIAKCFSTPVQDCRRRLSAVLFGIMGYGAFLIAAPIAAALLVAAWIALGKFDAEPPARSLRRFIALALLLAASNYAELLAEAPALKIAFAKLEFVAFLLLPVSFAWFCMRYTGHDRYVVPKARVALLVFAGAQFALIATNEWHSLFWSSIEFISVEGFVAMRPSYGPLFWLSAVYAWALMAAGAFVVLRSYVADRGPYRTRSLAIVAGTLLPALFNAVYLSRLVPALRKDFSPVGYALAGLCFFGGAYLNRVARVIPLARGVVLEELDEGVVFFDPAGRLADFNRFAGGLLGLSSQMLGRPVMAIQPLEAIYGAYAQASASPGGIAVSQLEIAGKSVVASAKRIGGRAEQSRGVAITLVDISERVRLRDELDAAKSDLLKREHFAVIGRLSADIAHEVNNPLGYVWAEVRSVRDAAAGSISDERVRSQVFEMIAAAEDGLGRIERVVRSLLEYARRGSADEAPAPYDLAGGVRSALELSRSDYARIAAVDVDLAATPSVMARGTEIDRVIINILRNAAEAVRTRVSSSGGKGRIWVRTALEDRKVVCEIGNDGRPIAEGEGPRVFEEFFSTKAAGKGSGLGLSISKDIVEKRHSGRLTLASRDPVVFRMELPIAEPLAPGL